MSVWRCSICSLNVPSHVAYARFRDANEHTGARRTPACPVCDEKMIYFSGGLADEDWESRVADKTEPPVGGSPHPAEDAATVVYRNDTNTVHVSHKELVSLGYEPCVDLVVKLNGKFYELEGRDPAGHFWWISAFGFAHDLAVISTLPEYAEHGYAITDENGEEMGFFTPE